MVLNIQTSNYNNANGISISAIISGLGTSLLQTYKDFGTFFFGNGIVVNANYTRGLIYAVFFLSFIVATITAITIVEIIAILFVLVLIKRKRALSSLAIAPYCQ